MSLARLDRFGRGSGLGLGGESLLGLRLLGLGGRGLLGLLLLLGWGLGLLAATGLDHGEDVVAGDPAPGARALDLVGIEPVLGDEPAYHR
jgi:hypothetical protein